MSEGRFREVPHYDYTILVPAVALLVIGLVVVYSASAHLALYRIGDSYFYLKRQAVFALIGIGFMVAAKNIKVSFYEKMVYPLLILSLMFLIMVLIPGLGHKAGHASRWISLGFFSFQPSELAKFALVLYLAQSMAEKKSEMAYFSRGLIPHLAVAGIFLMLVVVQPDLGTAVILGTWVMMLLFVGGVRIRYLVLLFIASAPVLLWLVLRASYRMKRIFAFLNPWDDPRGIGFQIIHSFLAFGSGGVTGAGLGDGKQKLFYLPEPHTDFILSVAAEELGFLRLICIMGLFILVVYRGISVSLKARDLYSCYLALGISSMMGIQVLINMAVVMGLLPTKGLTLPLMSYGGSSLVMTLFGIGVLLSISSQAKKG
ncbi:MAG: putative lipid II flippase FtsW [Deltaproteobacteria bacterium CG_4_8_14_3_um_filter_51_11]|nr:putative lipid II flippase FtsW [bacterium]OIP43708.1 MAG: putative lipid II flippase FtsW [Desulfobacteraceae bacterium CG2_30_51_40]PIP48149.1 MAG: putative lipid II flippase FtsW [Deltaproteobacteria bacterium CG23_combo_of_CG06-09_8_20_14_all_51_20]PIW01175.1 MAG: putative lipid II flippase FtsW [Deltaproteobacteria bacterium CG17_big_fil_post_rev_8_21_14_2_50_51_6]PIX19437.1 MAG: putative lipid II flippase FtsW [Deltaproteobacteria bacterium CG_4_8_14_3_um_filter_51_11]PIY23318.1 MAG: 